MLQLAVAGLITGGGYALLAVCLVLLYRMVGVLNFAQAAIGTFGTYVMLTVFGNGLPYGVAGLLGLATGAALAAGLGFVMARWFAEHPPANRATVTIAVAVGLLVLGFRLFGDAPRTVPAPFPGVSLRLAGVVVPMASIAVIVATAVVGVVLSLFLTRTRTGVRLLALSERPVTAELHGVPVRPLTIAVWAGSGAISAAAIMAIAPTRPSDFLSLGLLILPAVAAALLGAFNSIVAAVAGGIGIGIIESVGTMSDVGARYRQVIPFVVILVALLWQQRTEAWDEAR